MAQNFQVPVGLYNSATNPTTPNPVAGDTYYNTSSNEIRVYNGTAWVAVGGGGAAAAGTLTGTTLASNVVNSSLTSFGASPTITTPALTLSATTSNTIGRIAWDNTNSQIEVGNGSALKIFTADDATATLTNKTISGASNTISTTGTLTIGTGLSGTSFNGSANVTVAVDSTVATLSGTQTLTNKTLTAPIITQPVSTPTLTGATYTLQASENGFLLLMTGGSATTVSIPSGTFPVGTTITLLQQSTGQLTIQAANAGITNVFSGGATVNAPRTRARYSSIVIVQTTSENWYAMGDLI